MPHETHTRYQKQLENDLLCTEPLKATLSHLTRRERQLENDLRSLHQLCGHQLCKIQKLQATIAKLEKRLNAAQDAPKV